MHYRILNTMRWMLLVVALQAGCLRDVTAPCTSDQNCETGDNGTSGKCERSVGFCSFTDTSCTTGQRFGNLAGSYSNACVGVSMLNPDGGQQMESDAHHDGGGGGAVGPN